MVWKRKIVEFIYGIRSPLSARRVKMEVDGCGFIMELLNYHCVFFNF